MNPAPQIPGYDLGQRLLQHPLAEIWRGRSRTGLEVVAIVLSDAGAADPQVRERLDHASRGAALEPGGPRRRCGRRTSPPPGRTRSPS